MATTQIHVIMKTSRAPLKRIPVILQFDDAGRDDMHLETDRTGTVYLEEPGETVNSGRILVDGRTQYQGRLSGDILIELWSLTGGSASVDAGSPQGLDGGSIAYPSMQTSTLLVNGQEILTDSEGYIVHPGQWSEAFVKALAAKDGLTLTEEHWEIIRYLRDFYDRKHLQCTVRDMIKHFRQIWGKEKGSNKYLHQLFPRGGPQKQGNRLAGLLRTKGEH